MYRPFSLVRPRIVAGAVFIAAALAGCTDSPVAPDGAARRLVPGSSNAVVSPGGPSASCAAIAATHPGAPDGQYAINVGGKTFAVYCAQMASTPAEYLTLAATGSGKNFGSWTGDHMLQTYFTKVRLNLATLQVKNDDYTFSTTYGGSVFGPGVYLYQYPYASAGDCLGSSPQGAANVDLTGTPFSIHDVFLTDGWYPGGYVNGAYNGWGGQIAVNGKIADLIGGGYCGGTTPNTSPGYLQLAFTGPALASPGVKLLAPSTSLEGQAVRLSAFASHPAGVTFWTAWDLGDGTTGVGPVPSSHVYADEGTYTVTFTASDGATPPTVATKVIAVANVPPTVSTIAGATLYLGETYSASGSFADPGLDTWTATVDYGSGATPLALTGKTFSLRNTYKTPGTYTVKVTVTDNGAASGTGTAVVTVLSPAQATQQLAQLIASTVATRNALPLIASLSHLGAALLGGSTPAAVAKLNAFDAQLSAALKAGQVNAATYAALADFSARIRAIIG